MTLSFDDLVRAQQLTRTFTTDPVPDELVEWMLDLAARAPRPDEERPLSFVVVRDPEVRAVLRTVLDAVGCAPVQVVVAAEPLAIDLARGRGAVDGLAGAMAAVQNLTLAAGAVGLGAAVAAAPLPPQVGSAVGLPELVQPVAVVGLGRSAQAPTPPVHAAFESVTHRERYGAPWDQPVPVKAGRGFEGPGWAQRLGA
jgi:nitroreductase